MATESFGDVDKNVVIAQRANQLGYVNLKEFPVKAIHCLL